MEQKTYRTSEAARLIGVHPNTVRLYEDLKLISRRSAGQTATESLRTSTWSSCGLVRTALQVEVLLKTGCASRPLRSSRPPQPGIWSKPRP